MSDHGSVQLIVPADKATILTRLLLSLVTALVVSYWFFVRYPRAFPSVLVFFAVIWVYTLHPLVRLLLTGKAIVLTDQGLIDRTGGLEFVRWAEIREARIRPYMGLKLVELGLTDLDAVLARLPVVRRVLLRYSIRTGSVGPYLKASFAQGGADALMRVIEQHAPGSTSPRAV